MAAPLPRTAYDDESAKNVSVADIRTENIWKDKYIDRLANEIDGIKDDIKSLRAEMQTEFKAVRNEMQAEFKAVRNEIKDLRAETQAEIKSVRDEIKDVRDDIKELRGEVKELNRHMQILFVTMLAGIAAVIITR